MPRAPLPVVEGIETALLAGMLYLHHAAIWAALSAPCPAGLTLPEAPGEPIATTDGDPADRERMSGAVDRCSSSFLQPEQGAADLGAIT